VGKRRFPGRFRQYSGPQNRKLADLERRIDGHDTTIRLFFEAIRQLMAPPPPPPPKHAWNMDLTKAQKSGTSYL
jgi:hypothetical protein